MQGALTLTMFVGVVALCYQHHTPQSEKARHFTGVVFGLEMKSCAFKTQNLYRYNNNEAM